MIHKSYIRRWRGELQSRSVILTACTLYYKCIVYSIRKREYEDTVLKLPVVQRLAHIIHEGKSRNINKQKGHVMYIPHTYIHPFELHQYTCEPNSLIRIRGWNHHYNIRAHVPSSASFLLYSHHIYNAIATERRSSLILLYILMNNRINVESVWSRIIYLYGYSQYVGIYDSKRVRIWGHLYFCDVLDFLKIRLNRCLLRLVMKWNFCLFNTSSKRNLWYIFWIQN